jgi:hypothetical protein
MTPKISSCFTIKGTSIGEKIMSKEKKGNKETKKAKKESDGSKKQKKDPKRHDGLGGK